MDIYARKYTRLPERIKELFMDLPRDTDARPPLEHDVAFVNATCLSGRTSTTQENHPLSVPFVLGSRYFRDDTQFLDHLPVSFSFLPVFPGLKRVETPDRIKSPQAFHYARLDAITAFMRRPFFLPSTIWRASISLMNRAGFPQ
jgi:hypothetical protein